MMVWNLEEVALKPYAYFYTEIVMLLEASGGCCAAMIDGLESLGGCSETIHALLQDTKYGFGSFGKLLCILH